MKHRYVLKRIKDCSGFLECGKRHQNSIMSIDKNFFLINPIKDSSARNTESRVSKINKRLARTRKQRDPSKGTISKAHEGESLR